MTIIGTMATDPPVVAGGRRLRRPAGAARQASYDDEVRTLITAAQTVMARCGRTSSPRVADILAEAGLSNQAFYRHFRGRDDLIVATYEQGLLDIYHYLRLRVSRQRGLTARLSAWITGLLAQIDDPELAEMSSAILWNVNQIARGDSEIAPVGHRRILGLLTEILRDGGVDQPDRTARFIQTLVLAMMSTYLESGESPSDSERDHLLRFCLAGSRHP
ncbi:MAG: TetR/AcrR family transcriptional regulator [Gordonia sp. (in: high G+C Gram-positive bacteria)]